VQLPNGISIMERIITLDEFVLKSAPKSGHSEGHLTRLLRDIGIAAKVVNRKVNRAGLENILGVSGSGNKSGDDVQSMAAMLSM